MRPCFGRAFYYPMNPQLVKSLEICWLTIESDYIYAVSILGQLGLHPEADYSDYLKLWAIINTGNILGKDVTKWEPLLAKEIARIEKNKEAVAQYIKENEDYRKHLEESAMATAKQLAALEKEIAAFKCASVIKHHAKN